LHGRPCDSHTLKQVLMEYETQTGIKPKRSYVDRGYWRHDKIEGFQVFKSGQKRGVTAAIKKELRRRSAVEPLIGHLKNEGRMGRNYLKGKLGDSMNALMVCADYNFKLILRWLRFLFLLFLSIILSVTLTDKEAFTL